MSGLLKLLWLWCVRLGHTIRDWLRRRVTPHIRTPRWSFQRHRLLTYRRGSSSMRPFRIAKIAACVRS